MTATLNDVTPRKKRPAPSAEEQAAAELVRLAKEQGLSLTGPDHDRVMPGESVEQGDVAAWFEARGLVVRVSDTDYSNEVRSNPWGRKASSRDHHVWVDLLAADGRLIQRGYGSGVSADDALRRARQRYQQEQGD